MLLTVTMNPSVDISYRLNQLVVDDVNRTNEDTMMGTLWSKTAVFNGR